MSRVYQRKDHLYRQAKEQGYRSRAAYKLKELNKKYQLLGPGMKVLDLGCYPGGWLQVALELTGANGLVCGVDLREVESVECCGKQAIVVGGDIENRDTQNKLLLASPNGYDVVLSDLSPQLSGIAFRDQAQAARLVETAFNVALDMLTTGGAFVAKIFPGEDTEDLIRLIKPRFSRFDRQVLSSSRSSSKEFYLIGRGLITGKNFKENENINPPASSWSPLGG